MHRCHYYRRAPPPKQATATPHKLPYRELQIYAAPMNRCNMCARASMNRCGHKLPRRESRNDPILSAIFYIIQLVGFQTHFLC